MSSLIPGYNYDIFVSYRQKDNKHDGWVTEFVENLKGELESTFKEKISVYFDNNPFDGLLETHDVDESLKEKLKCLIFIPILSRTYCDPRTFAWEKEFKSFVSQASEDQYGLKLRLSNGNVAGRVLPVRIHDLDMEDLSLFESVLGGVLRDIEFIYKEPGVNRPLTPDDDPKPNLNNTRYRNQINKVALAIKDIMTGIKSSGLPYSSQPEIPNGKVTEKETGMTEGTVRIEMGKPNKEGKSSKISDRKREEVDKGFRKELLPTGKTRILLALFLTAAACLGFSSYIIIRHSRVKWAKNEALKEIEQHIDRGDFEAAYDLVQKAGKYISQEPAFQELSSKVATDINIVTDPPGADVYIRKYSDVDGEWEKLGRTPVNNARIAGSSYFLASVYYLIRIEKPGYEDVLATFSTETDTLHRKLFEQGTVPADMVYVERGNGFFIDRYEVTNKQYKAFIDSGGYSNPAYWKNEFKLGDRTLSWREAMSLFVDKTGRPGPSIWEVGDYPDGEDNYPVRGISWYEAAAYAEYAGKDLPASNHWDMARGGIANNLIVPVSNFDKTGPEAVGAYQGIGGFGTYDMAGNVREWCWNETQTGHIVRGGAWDDASYLYASFLSQVPSFDRSPENGFRCVKYVDKDAMPEQVFQPVTYDEPIDYSTAEPVPDNIFEVYKSQFSYDSTNLQEVVEELDSESEDWTIERITFNAAYENEKVTAYLFLPTNVPPPYQTLVHFPGIGGLWYNGDLLSDTTGTFWWVDYLLKDGRAVLFPVFEGMYERAGDDNQAGMGGYQGKDMVVKWVKDFKKSLDYLETRPDIDTSKLGYYGFSIGGFMGGIIPAVDDRLKVNVLISGGMNGVLNRSNVDILPEVSPLNYLSRIDIPTLMLNGKYDFIYPYEEQVKPFYDLINTQQKKLILYETGHGVPKNEMIKEVLAWCDKYLGPVK